MRISDDPSRTPTTPTAACGGIPARIGSSQIPNGDFGNVLDQIRDRTGNEEIEDLDRWW
jgi:hypothetical protein